MDCKLLFSYTAKINRQKKRAGDLVNHRLREWARKLNGKPLAFTTRDCGFNSRRVHPNSCCRSLQKSLTNPLPANCAVPLSLAINDSCLLSAKARRPNNLAGIVRFWAAPTARFERSLHLFVFAFLCVSCVCCRCCDCCYTLFERFMQPPGF
jgi:hypothetical protein